MAPLKLEFLRTLAESSIQQVQVVLFLAVLGALVLLYASAILIRALWVVFLRPGKNLRQYGEWAIVTGATDGIGKAFAVELAKQRISLVLVSRTQEKLDAIASQLQERYKVQVRTVVVDFADPDLTAGLGRLQEVVSPLEVGILVNNVGVSYPFAQYLHEIGPELITALLRVNVEATTRVTQLVLGPMVRRRKGAIVNIGSGAATVLPSDPLYAVYAATKAYVDQFSRTLFVEYRSFGIDIQCQAPLYVATKLAKIRHASLTCPSAATYAYYGVRWVGFEPRCTPYWAHSVMWWLIRLLPQPVMDIIRLRQNLSLRKRALAKEARKKQEQ